MVILVLNCGSSSIKYQVIDMSEGGADLLAKGIVDRVGLPQGVLTHKPTGKQIYNIERPIENHTIGIKLVLEALVDPSHGVIASLDELKAVGHRVAHGGEYFPESSIVDESAKGKIKELFEIAPLHNPANYAGIEAMEAVLPSITQVAVFDTSFHQTIPEINYMYAIPRKYYDKYRIRKYGFHGTSHRFVAKRAAKMTGLDFATSKIITCHVGNGGSVTAIKDGKSFDTSMGFTPLDGLIMGTRSGSMDVSAALYIAEKEGMTFGEVATMLNKESGVLGLTNGFSSDMRDIDDAYDAGDKLAILARDMHYDRVKRFIGQYAAAMGGVDLIVFTGGVGENSDNLRPTACEGLEFMGVEFDQAANKGARNEDKILSTAASRVKVAMIETNEEYVIAFDTFNLVK